MALRDLLVRFRIDVKGVDRLAAADKEINRTKDSSEGLIRSLTALGVAYVVKRAADFVNGLIDQAVALNASAQALGITTEELQAYQAMAKETGVPVQQVAVALRFFNRAVGEASFGTKSAVKVFGQLGIAVKDAHGDVRPTDDLLVEFSDKLKKIPYVADRTALAMRTLGRGGAALLPILQGGSERLREMLADIRELGGGFDSEFIEKANEVKRQQVRLSLGWRTMASELGKVLLPIMSKWLDSSVKHVKALIDLAKHTDVISHAIQFLTAAAGALVAGFLVMNAGLIPLIAAWTILGGVLYFIFGLFDDFATFMSGGDSMIGRMLDKMGGSGTAKRVLADLTEAFDKLKEAFGFGQNAAEGIGKAISSFLVDSLPAMVKWGGIFALAVVGVIDTAITAVSQLASVINDLLTLNFSHFGEKANSMGQAWLNRQQALQGVGDALTRMGKPPGKTPIDEGGPTDRSWMPGAEDLQPGFDRGSNLAEPGVRDPTGGRTPARSSDPLSGQNIINNITVNGNADPKAIGQAAGDATSRSLKDAETRNRDAFDAARAGMP